MPNATTKSISVTYFPLDTPADMGNALSAALTVGYRGSISASTDAQGTANWMIELNGPGNPDPVQAPLGNVLVWDNTYLKTMTQAQFTAGYTAV
jgi:hypothetical protein